MAGDISTKVQRISATIMIISDELDSARIWAFSLKQVGYEVCLAGFSERTLGIWSDEFPDIIVLEDLNSRMDVFEFCRTLRAEATIPILLLTSQNNESYLLEAYLAGADDCLPPPVSPRLFLAKIYAWLRRAQVVPSAALDEVQASAFLLYPDRRLVQAPGRGEIKLTNLESRLLYLLMSHPGWVLETNYLVDRVWGHFGEGDSVLLKNVVYRLRKKIEPDPSQPRYLLTESTIGYKFQPDGDLPANTNSPMESQAPGNKDQTNYTPSRSMRTIQSNPVDKEIFRAGRLVANLPEFNVRHTGQLRPNFLTNQ